MKDKPGAQLSWVGNLPDNIVKDKDWAKSQYISNTTNLGSAASEKKHTEGCAPRTITFLPPPPPNLVSASRSSYYSRERPRRTVDKYHQLG